MLPLGFGEVMLQIHSVHCEKGAAGLDSVQGSGTNIKNQGQKSLLCPELKLLPY